MTATRHPQPQSLALEIQGKIFAAELWGEAGLPVIALHGWLDNCHSFRPLVPHLRGVQVLALDMAGHGHSEHRSADASYHIWDDVREILLVAQEMGWPRFTLLGHSRGAIISTLIAASAPERVDRLVLLEGLFPQTMEAEQASGQLAKFLQRFLSFDGVQSGTETLDTFVRSRVRGGFGLQENIARMLVERNTERVGQHYYWRTDPRLSMPSPQMLTDVAADSFVRAIRCPAQLLLADQGFGKNVEALRKRASLNPLIDVMIRAGGHHIHMENPLEVAGDINRFLSVA